MGWIRELSLKRNFQVTVYLLARFIEDSCPSRAAALAYTTLLSLVPLFIVTFSILSLSPLFHGVGEQILRFFVVNFLADSQDVIEYYLHGFIKNQSFLAITSYIALFSISILMIYNMVRAFNVVWHVHWQGPVLRAFLLYLLGLILVPVLMGATLISSYYLLTLPIFASEWGQFFQLLLLRSLPYGITLSGFIVLNAWMPSCKVPWRSAVIGGLVTTILFELARFQFAIYVNYVVTYKILYGPLATIPFFLIWLYISWLSILFGAEVAHVHATGFPKVYSE